MKCRNCGTKVARGTQYCPNCGAETGVKMRGSVRREQQGETEFKDAAYVQQQLDKALARESRIKIALIISCVTLAILLIGLIPTIPQAVSDTLHTIVMIANVAAVAMSGLKASDAMLPKLLKGAWLVLPFPFDLVVGPALAIFLVGIALFFPAPFILGDFYQNRKLQKEAKEYLAVGA